MKQFRVFVAGCAVVEIARSALLLLHRTAIAATSIRCVVAAGIVNFAIS